MSVYTTELRSIVEMLAASEIETEDVNYQTLIEIARPKLFNFEYPLDETFKENFEVNFMKHFYLREICTGSFGRWRLYLDSWLNQNMLFYNSILKTTMLEIDPFITFEHNRTEIRKSERTEEKHITDDNTHEITRTGENSGTTESTNKSGGNSSELVGSDTTRKNAFSDTPQGTLANVDNMTYLTQAERDVTTENASKEKEESSSSVGNVKTSGSSSDSERGTNQKTSDESTSRDSNDEIKYSDSGFNGSKAELLLKYRETFMNVYKNIFDEMETLFMSIY